MAIILIPSVLRQHTEHQEKLFFSGQTIEEVLSNLLGKYPKLSGYVFDQSGNICNFISLYLNDEDVRFLEGKSTPVHENDILTIVPALAGG
jgi:sulfur-carrier protein